jgi:SAM-dependent methyltransferase
MLRPEAKELLIKNYRQLFQEHGPSPLATQASAEGQRMRFDELIRIADLSGMDVLDLGCGIADFYPILSKEFPNLRYTGIDLVPEMIEYDREKYPKAEFECRDILQEPLQRTYDYILISGMFNNAIPGANAFLKSMVTTAFQSAKRGLGFNFISTHVNFVAEDMAYHDPADILNFCINQLSRKTALFHHYGRCDVSVFVYRQSGQ